MASLKATNNPIGFNMYLFKKRENIKITRATAKTVLIMNAFLNCIQNIIRFFCRQQ